MERYLGLDVHAASCTFGVLSETGKRIRQDVVETHGEALVGYLQQLPGRLHLCLEESEWAPWLHEILSPHVSELVVHRAEGQRGSKSDARDAFALAERLRTGRVGHPVFKAPQTFATLRELASTYTLLSRDVARAKNRLKSRFRRRGVECAGSTVYRPETRCARPSKRPAVVNS